MTTSVFDRRTGGSLALNIGSAVGLALLTNLAIFLFPMQPASVTPKGFPPDWVIGSVWTVLFAGMGTARWLVATSLHPYRAAMRSVAGLILFCAAYPFYTGMLTNLSAAQLGNVATIIAAVAAAALCMRSSRLAGVLIVLVAAWTSYATYLTWREGHL